MSDDVITLLEHQLAVPLSGDVVREAHLVARNAERETRPAQGRRRGLVALVVAASVVLGGSAVSYAASPESWMWLFPPDLSKSFTFPNGVTCTDVISVGSDYSMGDGPDRGGIAAMQMAVSDLDPSMIRVMDYWDEAEAQSGHLRSKSPHVVEQQALMGAVMDALIPVVEANPGATFSSSITCE